MNNMKVEIAGYVYIMSTLTFLADNIVKIGYAADVEKRRQDLSKATGVLEPFFILAEVPVFKYAQDKEIHHRIEEAFPGSRVNPRKEFFRFPSLEKLFNWFEYTFTASGISVTYYPLPQKETTSESTENQIKNTSNDSSIVEKKYLGSEIMRDSKKPEGKGFSIYALSELYTSWCQKCGNPICDTDSITYKGKEYSLVAVSMGDIERVFEDTKITIDCRANTIRDCVASLEDRLLQDNIGINNILKDCLFTSYDPAKAKKNLLFNDRKGLKKLRDRAHSKSATAAGLPCMTPNKEIYKQWSQNIEGDWIKKSSR